MTGVVLDQDADFGASVVKKSMVHIEQNVPLDLSIHASPQDVNLDYYIDKITGYNLLKLQKYQKHIDYIVLVTFLFFIISRTSKLSDVSESQRAYMRSVEKDMLRNSVCQNMNHLRELYRKYATIATDEDFEEMDVLLIRLFLWQLLRDVEIYRGGKSLIEIDKFLAQNPDLLIEDPHDPFEPIYFWQFIQIVFALACHFYKVGLLQSVVSRGPICASIFKAFLHNEVLVKIANPTGVF